jgi:hypothetical protein
LFAGVGQVWEAARLRGDVDCMCQVSELEATLVQRHGFRSEECQRPAASTRLAAEEPRTDPFTGEAFNQAYELASLRKRRFGFASRPEFLAHAASVGAAAHAAATLQSAPPPERQPIPPFPAAGATYAAAAP